MTSTGSTWRCSARTSARKHVSSQIWRKSIWDFFWQVSNLQKKLYRFILQVGSTVEQHWRHLEALSWQTKPECDRGNAQPGSYLYLLSKWKFILSNWTWGTRLYQEAKPLSVLHILRSIFELDQIACALISRVGTRRRCSRRRRTSSSPWGSSPCLGNSGREASSRNRKMEG